MRVGERIVTLPRTRSSTMKFRPVTSLTNLARTGSSTSWKLSAMVASSAPRAAAARRTSRPATTRLIGGRRRGSAARRGRRRALGGGELERLLALGTGDSHVIPVDRGEARAPDRVAHAVELLAVAGRVLDHGAGLAAPEADAPESQAAGSDAVA